MQDTSARSGAARPTVDQFLRLILRSGLLSREQLQESLRSVPVDQRQKVDVIAAHLIQLDKLSRFQVSKLLMGTARGLVLGPFHVLAPIGRGGMGTVYLARDSRSGQMVALKVLPPRKARTDERLLTRFRREMEMCQRVAHTNLAWTYEVGVCQGVYFIAMEFIPGKTLHRLIIEEGPLPLERACRLMAEVCTALAHAHERGIIHRDIKPANIMVTPRDHAKVLDLGLALVEGEKGGDREVTGGLGYVVGTMDYISPEQATNPLKVDARSDIYSLGCTLYYVITGQPPFPGGTSKDKLLKHREEDPPWITDINPLVPVAFSHVVHKLLSKDADRRYPSMEAVEQEMRRWMGTEHDGPQDKADDPGFLAAIAEIENRADEVVLIEPILDSDEESTVAEIELIADTDPVMIDDAPKLLEVPPPRVPIRESVEARSAPLGFDWHRHWPFVLIVAAVGAGLLGVLSIVLLIVWLR